MARSETERINLKVEIIKRAMLWQMRENSFPRCWKIVKREEVK